MVDWFSTSGAFDASGPLVNIIPNAYRADVTIFLWGGMILLLLSAYFSVRRIEENLKRVMGLYMGIGIYSFVLTGHLSTVIFFAVVMVLVHLLSRLHARRQEYGSNVERELEDIGAGGSGLRQRLENTVRVDEELAANDNKVVSELALAEAREGEEAGAERAVVGGADVLPEKGLALLNTSLTDEQRTQTYEVRLASIASRIAQLDDLPKTAQESLSLMLEFLHELVLESEKVVESEQGADRDRLKVIGDMKKVIDALKKAAKRAQRFNKEVEEIGDKTYTLETKNISTVRDKLKEQEDNLERLEAKVKSDPSMAGEVAEVKATLENEIKRLKQGYNSLMGADRALYGLKAKLVNNYLGQMHNQLAKIGSTLDAMNSVEKTLNGFEGKEQQLKESLAKAQSKFATSVADSGHDKLEGHLDKIDDLVIRSQPDLAAFFDALSQSKKALLKFYIELKAFLEQVTALAAETYGLESLSAASRKLQAQLVEGFVSLDGLANKLVDSNPLIGAELAHIGQLSKQTGAELLQGVEVENKLFDHTMIEVGVAQSRLNEFGKLVEDELRRVDQTKQLAFSSLSKILKLVAIKKDELTAEVTQQADGLARDIAANSNEMGSAEKVA